VKQVPEATWAPPGDLDRASGPSRPDWDRIYTGLTGVAVSVAVILRWYGLGSQSMWNDEGSTVLISRFSPADIVRFIRTDTAPPLHYVLAHYWMTCFGTSVWAWRGLSALCATLAVPLFYFVARKVLADRAAEALAMAACAVSFFQISYAQEARCYSMLALFLLGAIYSLLLFLDHRRPFSFLLLVLFVAASLYTHNMAFLYLPGLALMWLLYPSPRSVGGRIADMALAACGVLLLYAPWFPILRQQLHAVRAGYWVPRPRFRDPFDSLCMLLGLDATTLSNIVPGPLHVFRLFGYWTWLAAGSLVLALSILGGLLAARSGERRKTASLAAYSILPVLLVFFASRVASSVYLNRVFIGSSAVLPLVLAAPIAFQAGNRRRVFAAIALLTLGGIAVSAVGYPRENQKEDWRSAANYLVNLREKRRLVVGAPDGGEILLQYYAPGAFRSPYPVDITGLYAKLDLRETRFEPFKVGWNADPTALIASEISQGKYNEIDVAFQQTAIPLRDNPVVKYLQDRCASLAFTSFHRVDVSRCFLPPR
jgi:4-amino-4-deoxy-L-arabinose transferase-like glycosyltransferase